MQNDSSLFEYAISAADRAGAVAREWGAVSIRSDTASSEADWLKSALEEDESRNAPERYPGPTIALTPKTDGHGNMFSGARMRNDFLAELGVDPGNKGAHDHLASSSVTELLDDPASVEVALRLYPGN